MNLETTERDQRIIEAVDAVCVLRTFGIMVELNSNEVFMPPFELQSEMVH